MKKKIYYDHLEGDLNVMSQENNKLKLDNAALRAENQLLKRQLRYFEYLFAKKTSSTPQTEESSDCAPLASSNASSRIGENSDEENYRIK